MRINDKFVGFFIYGPDGKPKSYTIIDIIPGKEPTNFERDRFREEGVLFRDDSQATQMEKLYRRLEVETIKPSNLDRPREPLRIRPPKNQVSV